MAFPNCRLRAAKVLVIGMSGLGAEVTKNIVLAGVKSLTMMDGSVATKEDLCSQFFIPHSELGKNVRLYIYTDCFQQLNSIFQRGTRFFSEIGPLSICFQKITV